MPFELKVIAEPGSETECGGCILKGEHCKHFQKRVRLWNLTADSASGPRQSVEPYGEGRTANIVKHPLLAEMDLKTCEGGGE